MSVHLFIYNSFNSSEKGCTQCLGMCLLALLTILPEVYFLYHTDVEGEGLAVSLHSSSPKRLPLWRPVKFLHVFLDLAICTGHHHCGTGMNHPQTVPTQFGSIKLFKMTNSEAFTFPFARTKGTSPVPERQPHTVIFLH